MMFSYSLSFPFDSFHLRYITEASTFAGLNVFGSLSREMTLNRMVLFADGGDKEDGELERWKANSK